MSTIIIPTTLFGKLLVEPAEDLWEDCLIEMGELDLDVTLAIDAGVVTEENSEDVRQLLESLPALCRTAKDAVSRAYPGSDVVRGFVDYHLDEVPGAELARALHVDARDVTHETFFDALLPCHFTLTQAPGGVGCWIDFTIGKEYSDDVLCVRFDGEQRIFDISHES